VSENRHALRCFYKTRTAKVDPEDDARNAESLLSSRDASTVRTANSGEEEEEGKNIANALDLSESEEDEELEDLVEDFLANNLNDEVCYPINLT
jgi:hypothetical protein